MHALAGFQHLIGPSAEQILWWQMCVRGVLIFVYGVALLRLFGSRAFGKLTSLDIVLAIIIGSTLSRTLTGNAPFFGTLMTTALLVGCFWALHLAAARWDLVSRLATGAPTRLVHDGRTAWATLRRCGVSERDLREAARQAGAGGLDEVREAVLERSGRISIVRR
jgi:uncharacterized membrane protein YcaP (DUF421 family)